MKRSEINKAIKTAMEVTNKYNFKLPHFAYFSPEDWKGKTGEYGRVVRNRLGWDVSDFGGGNFDSFGTVQFTLRNGNALNPSDGTPYAEKVIILKPEQRLPLHFHWSKTEDIINRGGGILSMALYNANEDNTPDLNSMVKVFCDGVERSVEPGEIFSIEPGGSITYTPGLFHKFWADIKGGILLCGEVSTINDDEKDNFFAEQVNRFTDIEEDEAIQYLLCNEYKKLAG